MKKEQQLWKDTRQQKKTAELNQPIHFKNVLTSEWKPGYVLQEEEVLLLLPEEKKSYGYHQI